MWKDVIQLKKPVRVPFLMTSGIHPFMHAGVTTEEGMYDYEKMSYAFKKYNDDFQTDTVVSCGMAGSGPCSTSWTTSSTSGRAAAWTEGLVPGARRRVHEGRRVRLAHQ